EGLPVGERDNPLDVVRDLRQKVLSGPPLSTDASEGFKHLYESVTKGPLEMLALQWKKAAEEWRLLRHSVLTHEQIRLWLDEATAKWVAREKKKLRRPRRTQ